jgi:hypothetical protein
MKARPGNSFDRLAFVSLIYDSGLKPAMREALDSMPGSIKWRMQPRSMPGTSLHVWPP